MRLRRIRVVGVRSNSSVAIELTKSSKRSAWREAEVTSQTGNYK